MLFVIVLSHIPFVRLTYLPCQTSFLNIMPTYNTSPLCVTFFNVNVINLLLWIHRCPTDSCKLLRLHSENFTLPFQWAGIGILHGRKESTRWSVSWTVTYQLSSKTMTLGKKQQKTSCATVVIVTMWTYSCLELANRLKKMLLLYYSWV